jgi:hypothetical protein
LNHFSQLPAVKKDSKNGAARKFLDPALFSNSYFSKFLAGKKLDLMDSNFHAKE